MTEYDYTRKANEKIDVYHLEVALLELGTIRDPGEGAGYEPCLMGMATPWKRKVDCESIGLKRSWHYAPKKKQALCSNLKRRRIG